MTVINKSTVTVYIHGIGLKPNEFKDYPEMKFNTLNIHSDIGSCVITTEYGRRMITNYGKLFANEELTNSLSLTKDIIVTEKM